MEVSDREFISYCDKAFGPTLTCLEFTRPSEITYQDYPRWRTWGRYGVPAKSAPALLVVATSRWFGWCGNFTLDLVVGDQGERLSFLLNSSQRLAAQRLQREVLGRVPENQRDLVAPTVDEMLDERVESWLLFIDQEDVAAWAEMILPWLSDMYGRLGLSTSNRIQLSRRLPQWRKPPQ